MISDEMRELLSAYVDGELRDTDVARVEEIFKRDAELRREIESYRKLRKKLREWDEAEHGHAPSPALARRALTRARSLSRDRKEARRGRIVALLAGPASLAAALLLAVGGGLLAAWETPAEIPEVLAEDVVVPPPSRLPDLRLADSALPPYEAPEDAGARRGLHDLLLRYLRVDEIKREMLAEEEQFERIKARKALQTVKRDGATTGTGFNREIWALVRGWEPVTEPADGLVALRQARGTTPLPRVTPVPVGADAAMDGHTDPDRLTVLSDTAALVTLGEIWVGVRDRSRRTRVVAASSWIDDSQTVAVAWGDAVARPRQSSRNLRLQRPILGPKARRRLLAAEDRDPGFVTWLNANYGASSLADVLRQAERHEAEAKRMTAGLERDEKATGFAVVDAEGKLLGVELFASHELMAAYAARLLQGYLLEAGHRGIRLRSRSRADGKAGELVHELLDLMPGRATGVEEDPRGTRAGWAAIGLSRVFLKDYAGHVVGYGIRHHERPVHVTLFGR
ncbi:MAG: ARPP-1 family domain-containing protein [Planctomycetota bacterium]|jgi:hypothetical protein